MNLAIYRCFVSFLCFNLFSLTSINAAVIKSSTVLVAVNKSIYQLISVKNEQTQQLATDEDVREAAKELGATSSFSMSSQTSRAA